MPDLKISQLTATVTPLNADLFAIVTGGVTKKITYANLKAGITVGVLAPSGGGTGTSTAFTLGSVIFAGASGIYQEDNSHFFYDATNVRLGVGISSPPNFITFTGVQPASVGTGTATTAATIGAIKLTGAKGGDTTIATTGLGGIGGGLVLIGGIGGSAASATTSSISGDGGVITITSGSSTANTVVSSSLTAGGASGVVAITSGDGGSASLGSAINNGGNSGSVTIQTGNGGAAGTASAGSGGTDARAGNGGNLSFGGGNGGVGRRGSSTSIGGNGGSVFTYGGNGGVASNTLTATAGNGGNYNISGGGGGAVATSTTGDGGDGGSINITGGSGGNTAFGTAGDGGSINITAGQKGIGGSPTDGMINFISPVIGTPTFIFNGTNGTIKYTGSTPGSGYILTSDASGNASWVAPSAGVGATVTIVDDTTTNATMYPTWVTANSGNLPMKVSSTKMSFNPSTGLLASIIVNASTSMTTPLVIGGTGTTSTLTFRSTSNAGGTTGSDFIWQTGNNGATELMRLLNAGYWVIGGTATSSSTSATTQIFPMNTYYWANYMTATLAHGMTSFAPTNCAAYGAVANSAANGGFQFGGFTGNDATARALDFFGLNGSAAPSVAPVRFRGGKKSGTAGVAVAATEPCINFSNYTTDLHTIWGDGNISIGFATHATARIHIAAGTATASSGPLKLTTGTSLTSAEAGVFEFTTDNLFFTGTTGPTRKTIADFSYRGITALRTLDGSDELVNITSGTFTVTLPTAVGYTKRYVIKNSGTGIITIATTSSQTIDGTASGIITLNQYDKIIVRSDGSNWIVIS